MLNSTRPIKPFKPRHMGQNLNSNCVDKKTPIETQVNIYYNLTLENKRYIAHAVCI